MIRFHVLNVIALAIMILLSRVDVIYFRMIRLRLPSLKYRRLRGDLIQAYKIFKHFDDIDANKFFTEKKTADTAFS